MSLAASLLMAVLVPGSVQMPPPPPPPLPGSEIVLNMRSFKVPFSIDPKHQAEMRWVVLYWSTDCGKTWEVCKRVAADKTHFDVEVEKDGVCWFAVQTIDNRNVRSPAELHDLMPQLIVRVESRKR